MKNPWQFTVIRVKNTCVAAVENVFHVAALRLVSFVAPYPTIIRPLCGQNAVAVYDVNVLAAERRNNGSNNANLTK